MTTIATRLDAPPAPADDPFLWLEEIEGERALAWARNENERSLGALQGDPRYAAFEAKALEILQAADRIPFVSILPSGLYNFWQDERNVRGLWRRTTLASYRTDDPQWETVLDVDALAAAEKANWVFQGTECLPPDQKRCLIFLSDGGKDANVVREFDLETKRFVEGGFSLPEGKQWVSWLDADTILVARDWGGNTLTRSGYPFVAKRLRRGQTLEEATEIFRGTANDVQAGAFTLRDDRGIVHAVLGQRGIATFETEYTLLGDKGPVKLDLPRKSAPAGIVHGRLLLTLREDWMPAPGRSFVSGSLLSYDLAEWNKDPNSALPSLVFAPGPRQTLQGVATTRNKLILTILDNVRGKAFVYDYARGSWKASAVPLPDNATIGLIAASEESDEAMFSVTDYLSPTSLHHYDASTGRLETLKRTSPRFDSSRHVVEQFEAISKDGTRIPYFLIRPTAARMDGTTPTLLYGYGGFETSMGPSYSGTLGKLWLEQGNA
jgi:prolyl oligopeptidase